MMVTPEPENPIEEYLREIKDKEKYESVSIKDYTSFKLCEFIFYRKIKPVRD